MRKLFRGNTLAFIGLFLGLLTGAVVLYAKSWLVNEIVTALEDEVVASCECSLAFDSLSLSFTTLRAKARNVRIVEKGIPKLSFKTITTKVDISEIRDKRVHLKNLTLNEGTADGVGPDSVTFRFIDQLTKPLPPELQRPDRWRVILDSLEVKNSFLRESFGTSEISGSGVSLKVESAGDDFELQPRIADFRYTSYGDRPGEPPQELFLGPLSAEVTIQEARTLFKSIILGRERSNINASGTALSDEKNTFSGQSKFTISTDYIGLPDWLRGILNGETTISGTLGSPILNGSVENNPKQPFLMALPNASVLSFPKFSSSLNIDVNHGEPVVTLDNISAVDGESSLIGSKPLTFSGDGLAAGFTVKLPRFTYGPFSVARSTAEIDVSESPNGILTEVTVRSEDLQMQGFSLGPGAIDIKLTPDQVKIKAENTNRAQGSLKWDGVINLSGPEPLLTEGILTLNEFRYPLTLPVSSDKLAPLSVTTQTKLSGPMDLKSLIGQGDTTISFPALVGGYPFTGKATLKDGVLKVSLPSSPTSGNIDLQVDMVKSLEGKLRFSQPETKLRNLLGHDDECSKLGGSLTYNFPMQQILSGTGELLLTNLSIGCSPYSLSAPQNSKIPIRSGALQLKGLALSTLDNSLNLDGEVGISKGFDMSARGRLELSSLLPLLSSLDDLRGSLKTDLSLKGSLSEPTATGSAVLSNGQFGVSSPELGGHHISGDFSLAGRSIRINRLDGAVNGGKFNVSGVLLPFDPSNSSLKTNLKDVTIEPVEDSTITFSGDFTLGTNQNKRQSLSGNVDIIFAEIAKDFDINKIILNTISGYFVPSRIQTKATKQNVDIDLDVKISAPRNIFIVTPFLSAELNTNITARGSVTAPALDGTMQILSGWIGLKGNRFDITSGGLTFRPSSLMPNLEISGEGNLRAPTGESILVTLDASGPISSPKFSLNSDRGLAQSELLLLLTSSRPLGESSIKGRMDSQFASDKRFFISDTSFSSFKAFFTSLTRLDTLSFEPAYNQFTGTIEPAVVARKNISPRMTLLGESLFSSVSNSRAGGVYSLTPSLDINAFFQTVSTQKNSILSSDLTYTVWSEESRFVNITIKGTNQFSEQSILNAARLGPSSRISNTPDSLKLIQHQIKTYMTENGFTNSSADIVCYEGDTYCRELTITVTEGPASLIENVSFEGDTLTPNLQKKAVDIANIGSIATGSTLSSIERTLVLALRNEGYIAARVTPTYKHDLSTNRSILIVNSEIHEPISFSFTGNKEFSADDFLNSIELYSRKRPFGNNTITLLIQNMERMYQERGYLFAKISHVEDRSDPERLTYRIAVVEESPMNVRRVTLKGNSRLSRAELIRSMREMGMREQVETFDPKFAVPARLEALRDSIVSSYHHQGYPDAAVSYTVSPVADHNSADIEFTIDEGAARLSEIKSVVGYPTELSLPTPPEGQLSLPRINIYTDLVIDTLENEGYLAPAVFVEPDESQSYISLTVDSGARAMITSVSYDGLVAIPEITAKKATRLEPNQPLREEDINATKKELLKTGLFSRVEVVASDGTIDSASEAVTIKVVERPLQTLELGLGANSEFGLHTFGEAVNKSLFMDGRTLSARVDTYFDQAQINPNGSGLISQGFTNVRYFDPKLFGSLYSLNEEIRYQRQQLSTQEFNLDRLLVGSYLFRQFDRNLTMSAGHSLVLDNPQDVTAGAVISDLDDSSIRLSFLSSVIKYDQRDDPLLPSSGYTFSFEPKIASDLIGSEANFASTIARSSAIVPLGGPGSRYSLGLGLSGGIAQVWGDTKQVPITQRMYLGGRTTVRGFRENSLGPRGNDGAVIGGDAMVSGKTQFQYLADDSLSTHLFFDFGNVFLRHYGDYDNSLRTSIGVGFQYLSPIGPIGFDVGHPLDERSGEPSVRVHFSVGSMF
jgi:outer membrane protein insertion porin family